MQHRMQPIVWALVFVGSATFLPVSIALESANAQSVQAKKSQRVQFEFGGSDKATGKTSDHVASTIVLNVRGCGSVTVRPAPGDTSKDIVDKLVAELEKAGFKVTRDSDTTFTIDEGPNGKALEGGADFSNDDTGVRQPGIKILPIAVPGVKKNGVQVPKAKAKKTGAKATTAGMLRFDVVIEKIVNNAVTLVQVPVVVPVQPGDTDGDLDKRARESLERSGLMPRDVHVPSVLDPRTVLPCYGLDRTVEGDPVLAITFEAQMPPEFVLPPEVFVGTIPLLGVTNQGSGSATRAPWIYSTDPYLGNPWAVWIDIGTQNAIGGLFVSPVPVTIPLPSLGPDAYWLVDPLAQVLLPLPMPIQGKLSLQLPLPPDPNLVGANLMFQAMVLDVSNVRPSTTDRLVVRPMLR